MNQFIIIVLIVLVTVGLLYALVPIKHKMSVLKDLSTLKTHTVNMLNKVLRVDTTAIVDQLIPDTHCDGIIGKILSPDELYKLAKSNPTLYNKLVACGYTKTIGLLHGLVLWSNVSKTKDMKSFKHFVECAKHIQWKEPELFIGFHSPKSQINKCII